MEEIELKPCPFCGGEAMFVDRNLHETHTYIRCNRCYASSRRICISARYCANDEAAEAWNKRVEE